MSTVDTLQKRIDTEKPEHDVPSYKNRADFIKGQLDVPTKLLDLMDEMFEAMPIPLSGPIPNMRFADEWIDDANKAVSVLTEEMSAFMNNDIVLDGDADQETFSAAVRRRGRIAELHLVNEVIGTAYSAVETTGVAPRQIIANEDKANARLKAAFKAQGGGYAVAVASEALFTALHNQARTNLRLAVEYPDLPARLADAEKTLSAIDVLPETYTSAWTAVLSDPTNAAIVASLDLPVPLDQAIKEESILSLADKVIEISGGQGAEPSFA